MQLNSRLAKISYGAAGLVVGGVLATTLGAQAATSTPSASTTSSSTAAAADPHPGDNGADGVPEAQEQHGGRGGALSLSGTVTAVGKSSVTIKTATATTEYSVTTTSDIDKSGEATLSNLVVGDKVSFSVASSNAKQIDKLHAGDETKNMPQGAPSPSSSSSSNG
jgi:hypothetical protein